MCGSHARNVPIHIDPNCYNNIQMTVNNLFVCLFFFLFIGIEARGFIFGPPIALAIGAKFVPLRKPKKLPG